MIKFIKYLILGLLVLFSFLYIAINSSYLFEKVVRYYAPKYNIKYDRIDGNVFSHIIISGLYYGDKKLARKIDIKINPATLLQKQVTISLLSLRGVNVDYIMYMVDKLSSDDTNDTASSKSSPLPISIMVKDIHISLLKFEQSDIVFDQSTLDVDYLYYANSTFDLGKMGLISKTSLGDIDIQGKFEDSDLHLSNVKLSKVNSINIEKLLDTNSTDTNTSDTNNKSQEKTQNSSKPNPFIPKRVILDTTYISILPREYQGVDINLLTLQGDRLNIDLESSQIDGDINLSLVTNLALVSLSATLSPDVYTIHSIDISKIDINATQSLLASQQSESNKTKIEASETEIEQNSTSEPIPYLAKSLKVKSIDISVLPIKMPNIDIKHALLSISKLSLDTTSMIVTDGWTHIDIDSDILSLSQDGRYTDAQLYSKITIHPKDRLNDRYNLPLRVGAIDTITLNSISSMKKTDATIRLKAKQLLDTNGSDMNIDINTLVAKLAYDMNLSKLTSNIKGDISTPYSKQLLLELNATLPKSGALVYNANISSKSFMGLDPKILPLLANTKVKLKGTKSSVNIQFATDKLSGNIGSSDLKKAKVHIETKEDIILNKFVTMPKELNSSRVKLTIDAPIDLNKTIPLSTKVKLTSNIINSNIDVVYDKSIYIKSINTIPKKSLLFKFNKDINFKMLSPLKCNIKKVGQDIDLKLESKLIKSSIKYNLDTNASSGDINLAGTNLTIKAPNLNAITLSQRSKSISSLLTSVTSIYKTDIPPMNGDLSLKVNIRELKYIDLNLKSNSFLLGKDKKSGTLIKDIVLNLTADKENIAINSYRLSTNGINLFANKKSTIKLNGKDITIQQLWIDDTINVTGRYNTDKKSGSIKTNAKSTKINHKMIDMFTSLNIKTDINDKKISIDGAIHLEGGKLKYSMDQKSFANDGDIVILQKQKKKDKNFINNFKINLSLDTRKPIIYKKKGISVSIAPNLVITKRYRSNLRVNGKLTIKRGGYYILKNKRFTVKKGIIYFKGNPSKPRLDIDIGYKHLDTSIGIKVTGTPAEPSLNFYSNPHMNREQILSYILFDTKQGADANQREGLTNLAASALTKSLISSMGIKLDHLVLSGTGFEVGKKISDRITIIYNQEEKSSMKLKIENTKNIETDISFGSESQSADIFYKKEY